MISAHLETTYFIGDRPVYASYSYSNYTDEVIEKIDDILDWLFQQNRASFKFTMEGTNNE